MPAGSGADAAKQRILDAARRCFAEYGYEGATVRRLEHATGKSRGAIFHHFTDKETLFLAIASEDAARQAEVVARSGLVEVMRDMLNHPERYDWLSTRLEITRLLRTDPRFRQRWEERQSILDSAVRHRLARNAEAATPKDAPDTFHHAGTASEEGELAVLHTFLETVMDGFITRLASGAPRSELSPVLDLVEETVRLHS